MWPEKEAVSSSWFTIDLGDGIQVPAQAALLCYLNRAQPNDYAAKPTKFGQLIWRGDIPGRYVVREQVLKAPEDESLVSFAHHYADRGEIDIALALAYTGQHRRHQPDVPAARVRFGQSAANVLLKSRLPARSRVPVRSR